MSEDDDGPDDDPLVAVAARITEQIRHEMRDTWRRDDQLLKKFFPVNLTSYSKFEKARKKLYNDNTNQKRWKNIPSKPQSAPRLCTPLRMLMNNILRYYGLTRKTRLFLDTHTRKKCVHSIPPSPISPSLFLAGVGDEFANTYAEQPQAFTQSGISPIEIVIDSEDLVDARDRLAVNMQQMFQNQDNRRFAYGLVLTETMITVYMFDHSGAVASKPFNYHQKPEQFCAVISGLASDKAGRLGFDKSIFSEGTSTRIRTFEPAEDGSPAGKYYTIKESLFQFSSMVGRGTICWLTSGPDDSESPFVVKDAWIAPTEKAGRESEGSLLRHAQTQGVVAGVVQISHFEEVRRGTDASDLDNVLRNRKVERASPEDMKLDRVHTRIVMETHGKTFDHFATRKELLLAFHDVVVAHRKLHDVAGILHRDISVRNILINPEGVEGNRGILIDFDHAIRVGDTSPYSAKTKIGTWRYMSRNVLDATGSHTYVDDLESFYYVICWILVAYDGPGNWKAELPKFVALWDEPASSAFKGGLFKRDFKLPVSPWFGDSLRRLAVRLHKFFRSRFKSVGKPRSSLDCAKDYDEFLSHVRQGIADLEQETFEEASSLPEHGALKSLEPASEPAKPASGNRGHGMGSDKKLEPATIEDSPSLPGHGPTPADRLAPRKRGREDAVEELDTSKRARPSTAHHDD